MELLAESVVRIKIEIVSWLQIRNWNNKNSKSFVFMRLPFDLKKLINLNLK